MTCPPKPDPSKMLGTVNNPLGLTPSSGGPVTFEVENRGEENAKFVGLRSDPPPEGLI